MKREYDFRKGKRGAVVKAPPGKTRITIRLDNDLLEWFRERAHAAGGGNYQTMINEALCEYVNQDPEELEEVLRRVVREEMHRSSGRPSAPPGSSVGPLSGVSFDMDYRERITIEPGKRGEKPCIRGLRITVYDVLEYLATGMTPEQILADFPDLEAEDISAVLAFAADRERKLSSTSTP